MNQNAANFDNTSAKLQPNKNTEYIDNRKIKENTSNEKQISEKEGQTVQRKNKSWADCPLTDHQRSIQAEDLKWALMVNNIRATKQLLVTVQSSPIIPDGELAL